MLRELSGARQTLGDSLREHNPDIHFVIGLVDRLPQGLPPAYYEPFEVLPVEKLGIPEFAEMVQKYNIVELNTATKPFYMAFLYERDPSMEVVIYLDPTSLLRLLCGFTGKVKKVQHRRHPPLLYI